MATARLIPTFSIRLGRDAEQAWRDQEIRCACGSRGDAEQAIAGEVGGMPAKWLGCSNPSHTGQALGEPLIYRLPSQMRGLKGR